MAAVDANLVQAVDLSSWTATDGTVQADLTTEAADNDLTTAINAATASKIGKGGSPHGHCLRVHYNSGRGDLSDGDSITIDLEGLHNVSDIAMLAYDTTTTVVTTAKVVATSVSGSTVFTITTAIIAELDTTDDSFTFRFVEDLGMSGDWQLSEVDSDLSEAGGTTFFQTNTGTITPSGTLVRDILKALAGALTPSGVVIKETLKALTGSLAPAGALIKNTLKQITGSLTPSGVLTSSRILFKTIVGALTPTGTLVKSTLKQVAGVLTPEGVITTVSIFARTVSGVLAPAGTLAKNTFKQVTGTLTPTGVLTAVKAIFKTITGSLTPTGTLTKQTHKSFAGSLTPTGVVVKKTLKQVAGAITPTAVLISSIIFTVTIIGVLTPIGVLIETFIPGGGAPIAAIIRKMRAFTFIGR